MATGHETGPCRDNDGGMEERRCGDGDTSSVPGAKHLLRVDANLADTPGSARRRRRRAWRLTSQLLRHLYGEIHCAPPTPSRRICHIRQRSFFP